MESSHAIYRRQLLLKMGRGWLEIQADCWTSSQDYKLHMYLDYTELFCIGVSLVSERLCFMDQPLVLMVEANLVGGVRVCDDNLQTAWWVLNRITIAIW